jgi:hypothetical protein
LVWILPLEGKSAIDGENWRGTASPVACLNQRRAPLGFGRVEGRMSACAKCEELNRTVAIRSPGELEKALRVIRGNLDDGTLVETAPFARAEVGGGPGPFTSIPLSGPWPGSIEHHFTCGRVYRLAVETFHGSGGSWSPRDLP